MSEKKKGICYLVGAGPGDPGLMTLRGKECIEMADVILYDHLSNPEFLAWAKSDAELIYAGKKATEHAIPQEELNEKLIERVREGKIVTRLKGGDPFVFGRGGEEADKLREAGLDFEFVSGISSAIAGPAYAGIPVTHRDHCSQVTIFTGHENPGKDGGSSLDYEQLAKAPGTKVMLMGVQSLRDICQEMLKHGADKEEPAAMIRWASTGRQTTVTGTVSTIADIAESAGMKPPAVAVFGSVVNCRDDLNWFEGRTLQGVKIVVTRARKSAGKLSRELRERGADVMEVPTIRTELSQDNDLREFAELIADAHTYDWLIFTSPNGVEYFFDAFYKFRSDAREIGGARIAAVGPATSKKLSEYRMATDLIPEKNYVAEGLIEAFINEVGSVENTTMLWVRAKETRDVLSQYLNKAGAILDEAIAYQTVPETADPGGIRKRFQESGADIVTFTSGSCVENFLDAGLEIPEGTMIATIGPITTAALEENGYTIDAEAEIPRHPRFDRSSGKAGGAVVKGD